MRIAMRARNDKAYGRASTGLAIVLELCKSQLESRVGRPGMLVLEGKAGWYNLSATRLIQ